MIKFTHSDNKGPVTATLFGILFFCVSLPAMSTPMALKKGESANMNIHITGTLIVKETCDIIDPINVEFNDVYIEEINSKTYKEKANYKVRCSAGAKDKTIDVRFNGLASDYDPSQFSTNIKGLSLKLFSDDKQIKPGGSSTLYTDNSSNLTIELSKQDGVTLPEKEFSAQIILITKLD